MGLLKSLRRKNRHKSDDRDTWELTSPSAGQSRVQQLPETTLKLIFSYVCPRAQDRSYSACDDCHHCPTKCPLCDARDLASCLKTCKSWREVAEPLLYTSVRMDAVHYCPLEDILRAQRRKNASGFRKSKEIQPQDVPRVRLELLARTVRGNAELAKHVQLLKIAGCASSLEADLASAIAVLPNLRYVDLPEDFFRGAQACELLRGELQTRCTKIAKMKYMRGSELSLDHILHGGWQCIEILQLKDIRISTLALRYVLASLPALQDLTLFGLGWLDDSLFDHDPEAVLPALHTLELVDLPNLTGQGLLNYLRDPNKQKSLLSLTIQDTGCSIDAMSPILQRASSLVHFSVNETVTKPMGKDTTPLASHSLQSLRFEIADPERSRFLQNSDSYYAHLASSLYGSAMPALKTLYVRERHFPERLAQKHAVNAGLPPGVLSRSTGQQMCVFSKDADELEWDFGAVLHVGEDPAQPRTARSSARIDVPAWASSLGEPRRSVVVGDGMGRFLPAARGDIGVSAGAEAQ